jgi:hypothetical protein
MLKQLGFIIKYFLNCNYFFRIPQENVGLSSLQQKVIY